MDLYTVTEGQDWRDRIRDIVIETSDRHHDFDAWKDAFAYHYGIPNIPEDTPVHMDIEEGSTITFYASTKRFMIGGNRNTLRAVLGEIQAIRRERNPVDRV